MTSHSSAVMERDAVELYLPMLPERFKTQLSRNLATVLVIQNELKAQPGTLELGMIKSLTAKLEEGCESIQRLFESSGIPVTPRGAPPSFSGELRGDKPIQILIESERLETLPMALSDKIYAMAVAFQEAKNELYAARNVYTNHIPRPVLASDSLRKSFAALRQACTL